MYSNRLKLTPNDIYEKGFKIDTKGYRIKEVDEFLDIIIEDYDEFDEILNELETNNRDLQEQITDLKKEIRDLEMKLEISDASGVERKEVTNVDLLRRLARLEKVVYNSEDE